MTLSSHEINPVKQMMTLKAKNTCASKIWGRCGVPQTVQRFGGQDIPRLPRVLSYVIQPTLRVFFPPVCVFFIRDLMS